MQDIINTNNAKATQTFFNTLFYTENMANFYAIGSGFSLTYHHFEKHKDLDIEININQPSNNWVFEQKWQIIRYIRSKEPY